MPRKTSKPTKNTNSSVKDATTANNNNTKAAEGKQVGLVVVMVGGGGGDFHFGSVWVWVCASVWGINICGELRPFHRRRLARAM